MPRSSFLPTARSLFFLIVPVFLALFATNDVVNAQLAAAPDIVVSAPELPSAYGAPASFSQSRFSPLTNAYVLPSGAVYSSIIYENDVVHFRNPDHHFPQE